jgi:hypothetical protein
MKRLRLGMPRMSVGFSPCFIRTWSGPFHPQQWTTTPAPGSMIWADSVLFGGGRVGLPCSTAMISSTIAEKLWPTHEGDGGMAVVDVDTLWRDKETGADFHWEGRAAKLYTRTQSGWRMIAHHGLHHFPPVADR